MITTEELQAYRHIDIICQQCMGWGVITYPTTSTWHGGIGGSAMTPGVCNRCWGSGDAGRPWVSHRLFYDMKRVVERISESTKT